MREPRTNLRRSLRSLTSPLTCILGSFVSPNVTDSACSLIPLQTLHPAAIRAKPAVAYRYNQ